MGFDQLLDMYLVCKYAQPVRRDICPDCAYPLEETERLLHCKACGWSEGIPPRYIPKIPEDTR